MLWECSSYSTCMDNFQEALKRLCGARYAEFETLNVLGSENWEDDFHTLLHLVKEFIRSAVNFSTSPQPEIGVLWLELVGKSGKSGVSHGKGGGHVVHAGVNCVCNVRPLMWVHGQWQFC